jgi:methylsterol monooxygenase
MNKINLRHFLFYYFISDMYFYASHRLLHTKFLYRTVHKKHHYFTAPMAISALYCNRTEMILSNIITGLLPGTLLGSHMGLVFTWTLFGLVNSCIVHSGYTMPFFILTNTNAHDNHHKYFNVNYGIGGLSDLIFGTKYVK